MDEIKMKVICKELNGGTSIADVTFSSTNKVTATTSGAAGGVTVDDINSIGASAGQVPTADGSGGTSWQNISIDLSSYAKISQMNTFAKSLLVSVANNIATFTLKDANGTTLGTPGTLDLTSISPIVNGYYDSNTQSIVFELNNENTITVPLQGVIDGFLAMDVVNNAFTEVNIIEG